MRTVTLTCDRCNKVLGEKEQFWNVELRFSCAPNEPKYTAPSKKAEWCRPCMEEFHLLQRAKEQEPVTTKPPTLEEILREIIGEEIAEAEGNRP